MKKKLIAIFLIALLLSSVFVGCELFEKDEYRDYHQIVATVDYETQGSGVISSVLYKGEVMTYVNTYAAYYMAQFQMSAEEVVESFYNQLTNQKLLVLYAQEYLYKNNLLPSTFKSEFSSLGAWNSFKNKNGEAEAYKKFITIDELRYCIEQTNKQLQEIYDGYLDELEKESEKNEDSEDDEDTDEDKDDEKDLLEARSKKSEAEDDEDAEYEKNESIVTEKDMLKYFSDLYEVTLGDDKVKNAYFTEYINLVIKKEIANKSKYDNMRNALKQMKERLEDQFADYDYFLVQQIQSYVVTKYSDNIGESEQIQNQLDKKVTARYDNMQKTQLKQYIDKEAYNTAIGSETFTLVAPGKDYLQVKSILLSFTEAQKSAITNLKNLNPGNDDLIKAYRDAIATGIVSDEDREILELYAKLGIKVNVSNPDYDSEEDKLKDAYTDATIEDKEDAYANPSVDYLTVLFAMAEDIKAKVDRAEAFATANNMSDLQKYLIKENASKLAFDDWINLVNDDSGMFSSNVYSVTPEGESTSYVPEYTVLARALTSAGVGATAIKDYADGDSTQGSVKYEGTTEILKAADGSYTLYIKQITTSVGKNEEELKANVYTLKTTNSEISFIVNEYGIHIVMLAGLPVDINKGSVTEKTVPAEDPDSDDEDKNKDKTAYIKGLDYVHNYSVKIEYEKDDEDNDIKTQIKNIDIEVVKLEEYLKDLIKDELSGDISALQRLELFGKKTYTHKKDKVYKQIVKYTKELNK